MPRPFLIGLIVVGVMVVLGVVALLRSATMGEDPLILVSDYEKPGAVRHPVSEDMAREADAATARPAAAFAAVDHTGRAHSLASLTAQGPFVLYFIKDGCPCSQDLEPLIQRLAARFEVPFVGVINGDAEIAEAWIDTFNVQTPILLDPELQIIRAYGIERSAYVAVIDRDGRIAKLWPGYSAEMLQELNDLVAEKAGVEPEPFDPLYAPNEITSGCYFYSDDPND